MAASPPEVFAVLAEGWLYSDWVVGTSHVRAVDQHWPDAGTRLHHATGVWPLVVRDETVVEDFIAEQLRAVLDRIVNDIDRNRELRAAAAARDRD